MNTSLLEVRDIRRHYPGARAGLRAGPPLKAVDGIDLQVSAGETLAIVGESGCGKSTLARMIAGLDLPTAGSVWIEGEVLAPSGGRGRRDVARRVQIVFQDPFSSLNPRMQVRDIVAEPLEAQRMPRAERTQRVAQLFEQVSLPHEAGTRLPHQFSGGQRQRIAIARALSVRPRLLVLDEPVSALDVSVRAQILNLLADLKRQENVAIVLISHDMSAVRHLADRVAVMYLGRIVEIGDTEAVFTRPAHPYTRTLLSAIPQLGAPLPVAESLATDATRTSATQGCRFLPRCAWGNAATCGQQQPTLESRPGHPHPVACFRTSDIPPQSQPEATALSGAFAARLAVLRAAAA